MRIGAARIVRPVEAERLTVAIPDSAPAEKDVEVTIAVQRCSLRN